MTTPQTAQTLISDWDNLYVLAEELAKRSGDGFDLRSDPQYWLQLSALVRIKGRATTLSDVHEVWRAHVWLEGEILETGLFYPWSQLAEELRESDSAILQAVHECADLLDLSYATAGATAPYPTGEVDILTSAEGKRIAIIGETVYRSI